MFKFSEPVGLKTSNLGKLQSIIQVPNYVRADVTSSIFHIGVGGFHRAHQAVYLDDLLHLTGQTEWGYCGVGLLDQDERMRDVMAAQDHLYTVLEQDVTGNRARVIGSIVEYIYAPADTEYVLERLAAEECRIVSLTITEGGYYVNEGNGDFNSKHPDILHDLQYPQHPCCSFGFLAEALNRRRLRGLSPFTIMSCDNLQHNGDVARTMLLAFAEQRDPKLRQWIADKVTFPNSMVDRIVPATTPEHCDLLRDEFSIVDQWPVSSESFRQWVIEDRFCNGRPDWERVGVLLTDDVAPFEKMKMRLLNGSHQALCYIGMLLGFSYAHDAVNDPQIRLLVQTLMDSEVTPLITAPPGIDLQEYKQTLLERLANPSIKDQLVRIGTEGSARIPKFILPSIREQRNGAGNVDCLTFTVAAWIRFLGGVNDQGIALTISDPRSEELKKAVNLGGTDPRPLFTLNELFGDELSRSSTLISNVEILLQHFEQYGARETLSRFLQKRIFTERPSL